MHREPEAHSPALIEILQWEVSRARASPVAVWNGLCLQHIPSRENLISFCEAGANMFSKSNDARDKRPARQPGKQRNQSHRIKIFGGLAAGFVGGIVATWALDKYQQGALEVTRRAENAVGAGPVLSRHQEE